MASTTSFIWSCTLKKLIATWLMVALGVVACVQLDNRTHTPTEFELACQALESTYQPDICEGLKAPIIIRSMAPAIVEAFGFYIPGVGEPYIYVLPMWKIDELRSKLEWLGIHVPSQSEVILHETVHYILDFNGDEEYSRCGSEAVARSITAMVTGEPEDPTWRSRYGCTDPSNMV
jgi:hypothetical protein